MYKHPGQEGIMCETNIYDLNSVLYASMRT